MVDESYKVENFHNGSEPTRELKIRRYLVPWGFNSSFPSQPFDYRSNPTSIVVSLTSSASQILNSVVSVIGRPASICCQRRAEKPNEIMSSWLWPRFRLSSRTRFPNRRKNWAWSITPMFLECHEHKHHEQISVLR